MSIGVMAYNVYIAINITFSISHIEFQLVDRNSISQIEFHLGVGPI